MTKIPELLELLEAGVHFGHKTSRWHPKMAPFIFGEKSGVHVINLESTQAQLKEALAFVSKLGKEGKVLLLVGTKKQATAIIEKYAKAAGLPYVNTRWLGGTVTNWNEIYRTIKKYLDLKRRRDTGELNKYTKKEQLEFSKEISRMTGIVDGMSSLVRIPDAIFIVDIKHEETVVKEANHKNVPIIAICDTNVNPDTVQYPIPGNDDAVKSIDLLTRVVAEAYKEGAEEAKRMQAAKVEETKTV